MTQLVVGKTYRNKLSTGIGSTRFLIERQWAPNIFEGRAVDSTNRPIGDPYLFTSIGSVLGFRGNTLNSSFPWNLVDEKENYEYRLIYENTVDNSWNPLTPSTPRYTYVGSKYMVRKKGDNSTLQIVDRDEFRRIQAKS